MAIFEILNKALLDQLYFTLLNQLFLIRTLTNALKIPTTVPMEIPFAEITMDLSSAFVNLNFAGLETTAQVESRRARGYIINNLLNLRHLINK